MSQENADRLDVVRRLIHGVNERDLALGREVYADDYVYEAARSGLTGDYRGGAGAGAYLRDPDEMLELFELRLNALDDLADQIVASGTVRLRPEAAAPRPW